jgi:hypothetical protein
MIIGLGYKLGVGKDTVGKIIQLSLDENAQGEFETLENYINNSDWWTPTWQIKKYADKLKDITCLLIGCTREQLEDREFKESYLGEEWNRLVGKNGWYSGDDRITQWEPMTVRQFMQLLGTEAGRKIIHPDIWVNALMADYKRDVKIYDKTENGFDTGVGTYTYPNWIISDVRFPNEIEAIKKVGGVVIRIDRETGNQDTHESERALNEYEGWNYVIDNNDSMESLIKSVRSILIDLKLI